MWSRKITLTVFLFCISFSTFAQLPGYNFYRILTIQSSQVQGPGNHLNFPVLIKHTDPDIRHTTSFGDVQNINGWDIRFTAADGVTLLDHQLESYDPVTGSIVAWVRVPSVSSTVNTDIRMYYGNSSVSADPSLTSTWNSRFRSVWHLHSDLLDGTSGGHTMTNAGSTNAASCIAADGQNFAVGQSLTRAVDATLQITGDITLEGWIRLNNFQGGTYDNVMFACGGGSETAANNFNYYFSIDGTGRLRTYWESGAGVDNAFTSSVTSGIAINNWMHIAVTRNVATNSLLFYSNGNQLGTAVAFTNDPTGGTNAVLRIAQDPFTAARDLRGDLDELRISDTLRSGTWIKTEYNSMNSPSTFYVIGPEYNGCPIPPTTPNAGPDQSVCAATATLSGNIPTYGSGIWTVVSGTGVVTTPTLYNSGVTGLTPGAATVFRWTISNGAFCTALSDDVTITRDAVPTVSAAGPDQSVCATLVATLAGNAPTTGTGTWTVIAGSATVTTPSSPTSGVTGLSAGVNTFRWTISNGSCPASTDDITITRYTTPSTSTAGPDQTLCSATATLAGNTPVSGTGLWTVITGSATITTPTSPTSGVTALSFGTNTFRWTISNGTCSPSTDDVTIFRDTPPTTAAAGPDQTICVTTATLAGNTPGVGTGAWTVIAGGGTVTTPTSPTSGVTGLAIGTNTFRWTISNGICLASSDDITINVDQPPTTSNAGPDQNVCAPTASLAGNTPAIGARVWTVIAGGATVTTPTSPISGVTGLTLGVNTFRWTITNGVCPPSTDDITITRIDYPTVSAAGPDQAVCATSATLAGNTPTVGTGTWTLITGGGTITTPTSPTSGITGLAVGANIFRWTISNGVCTPSTDDVIITRSATPTTAAAGPDQSRCATNATLAGNTPTTGTGMWTVIAGGATVTTPTSPTSGVTGLSVGVNTFRWTISNGSCTPSTDDVTVTRYVNPTVSAAGPDQNVCATTATLAGNTPLIGTGLWTVIAGTGTVTTPTSPTSGVTGLSVGVNTFRWTISNGPCAVSQDNINITRTNFPTTAAAGPDQNLCATTATLAGNPPTVGTGAWTVIAGGAVVTTPTLATSGVTALSVGTNTFVWTISNGICPPSTDTIIIVRDGVPTVSNAGPDQSVCDTVATLAGNTPLTGTGIWTVVSGSATITSPTSPTSGVTNLSVGVNTFRWTISNGTCTASLDDISITRTNFPTISDAGMDQAVCDTVSVLAGNTPAVGSGTWTVIAGTGIVTTPSSPTSTVTNLSVGINTFRWTIANGICPPSTDDVDIDRTDFPTTSNAGPDQTICSSNSTFAANAPVVGTASWTLVSGTGTITTPTSPTSTVTGLSVGDNIFLWKIINGICTSSNDTVTITVDPIPTPANAGFDSTICSSTSTLNGNIPLIGNGDWSIISGGSTLTSTTSATPGVSGMSIGLNSFVWTITSGTCPASADTVNYNIDPFPTTADAGLDQALCSSSATLAGNTPVIGTGSWTVISGGGTVTTPSSPTSGVTGLGIGANVFRWIISNGTCVPSFDDVTITQDAIPTIASAGPDVTLCASTITLTGNSPAVGAGAWSVITGAGTVTSPGTYNSTVSGMSIGDNTYAWTITNGTCPLSSDTVSFTVDPNPTTAAAGLDQTICSDTSTLIGNTPAIGTGVWTVLTGPAIIASPTSPTSGVSGLGIGVNTFRWTISNGTCPPSTDDITIIRDAIPTVAAAGLDQTVCSLTATLAGNSPTTGTGVWTVISGTATVTTPSSPTSSVTGLSIGVNIFRWTISNGTCPPSMDDVTIDRIDFPTPSTAGPDQVVCATAATLAGNIPGVGTGVWTVITGGATVTTPTSPTSGVTGLTVGTNTFRWTISNGTCTPSTDDITIIRDANPTISAAGIDQTVCTANATFAGNTPTTGTGMWTLISGGGSITTPSSPTSGVTGLSLGANTFRWTISNGVCTPSTDDVVITRLAAPTTSSAGPDQTLCIATATLAGNIPGVGTGVWTVISGGATVTTPTSPTSGVTGLTIGINTFRWTISNGICPPSIDDITIVRDLNPTISAAGPDQNVCSLTATLAGNPAIVGIGSWTVIAGSATVTTPTSPTSGVTGLSVGTNTFRWTITNGTCPASTDDITINRIDFPTTSNAGTDQTICATTATLAGNIPGIGTGVWTVITGGGIVTTPASPTSGVTTLSVGVNTFRWTITNGSCTPSTDDVTIIRDANPTVSVAGPDQNICSTTSTLAGNTATTGTGLWTVITGGATITTPSSPTSAVTGLSVGVNTFRWTISNGVCPPSIDDITITRVASPTIAVAGSDSIICTSTSNLNGNTPVVGTGVWTLASGVATINTPTSPTSVISALGVGTNVFVWTISNGICAPSTDTVIYYVNPTTTPANAGPDVNICSSSMSLSGNTPVIGAGIWTVIAGSGIVTTPSSATSGVTGMGIGPNVFVWTITSGSCPISDDTVTVTVDPAPTTSAAGPDQTLCSAFATLAGNSPIVGTGTWTVITGGATVTTPGSPTSTVSGLSIGINTFRWTITNGTCPPSIDDITIIRDDNPSASLAGTDQTVCASTATLAGNVPGIGTGTWSVIAGSGTVTTPASPTSGVTGLSVGVNTFRWTISNGTCPSTMDDVTINRLDYPTTSAAGPDQVVCATTASLAGNAPIVGTGLWTVITGGATITTPTSPTSGVTGLTIGINTFRWTISNSTCTPSTDDVTIIRDADPTISAAGVDQTVCSPTTTLAGNIPGIGTGVWTLVSGVGTLTSPGSANSGVTGMVPGVTVFAWTISNGTCPASIDSVTVTINPFPTPSAAGPDQSVCTGTATLAGNTPVVGTGAWTVIAGGATVSTPTSPTSGVVGLTPGANTFRWTISNGTCPASTDDITITLDSPPTTSAAGIDQTVCAPTTTLAGNSPVIGTGLWTLISGSGSITSPTSPTSGITGMTPGVSIFAWTISNGSCPSSSDSVIITINPFPTTAAAGADQFVCSDTASVFGNTPLVGTGTWTVISGTGTVTTPTSPTSGVTGLSFGINTFRWSISNGTCPASTDDITIFRDTPPTTSAAGSDQTLCSTTATLTGISPLVGTAIWTVIAGTGTVTSPSAASSAVTGLSIGINSFVWTISNGTCPSSTDTVNIIVDSLPTTANAGSDSTLCSSTSTLNGNIPTLGTGVWSMLSGGGTVLAPTVANSAITGMSVGTNVFVWTITNGTCPSSTDTVNYFVDPSPTAAAAGSDFTVCFPNASLSGNIPSVGTGTWTVISGGGTITSPGLPATGVTGMSIGANVFAWNIANGTCPTSSDTITITVSPSTTIAAAGAEQSFCSSTASLNGNSPVVGTGSWSVLGGPSSVTTPSSPTSGVTGMTPGANVFLWTISNGSCPSTYDTVTFTVDQFPSVANAGFDSILCSSASSLAGNIPGIGTGVWSVVVGTGVVVTPTSPTSAVSSMAFGTNTFVWTISNGTCPASTDTVTYIVNPPITTANAGIDTAICVSNGDLNGNIPMLGTGTWTLVSGSGIIASPTSPVTTVSGLSLGSNIFQWTISNGTCPPSVDFVEIFVDTMPTTANAGADIATNLTSTVLSGNTPLVGVGTWTVSSGAGVFANANDPLSPITGLSFGPTVITWTISNGSCPSSSDSLIITVNNMEIPNSFSPNGDNVNDNFEIPGLSEFKDVELNVFNRWGNQVYGNSDYKNEWNGSNSSGSPLSDDTYYYTLKLSAEKTVTGFVVIKRK